MKFYPRVFCSDCKWMKSVTNPYSHKEEQFCGHVKSIKRLLATEQDLDYRVNRITDPLNPPVDEDHMLLCAIARTSGTHRRGYGVCGIRGKLFEQKKLYIADQPKESKEKEVLPIIQGDHEV